VTIPFSGSDWNAVIPAFIPAVAGLLVLLADLIAGAQLKRYVAIGLGMLGAAVTGVLVLQQYNHPYNAFFGGFISGGFTTVFEEIVVIALLGSLVLYGAIGREGRIAGAVALMLWSATGALVMAGAANLMTIFLGLELLSLALYCLCGLADRAAARESALKYLILSSTASAFLLFGMALLFGASGSVQLADFVNPALALSPLFWMGSCMFAIGIAFKLSLVPFHAWSPDVYEGAPLPVTAFMSVATKAGVLAVFARFIYAALPGGIEAKLLLPIWIAAAISMIVGNVGMLAQRDLKRLLAYSGIAQVGYILTALAGTTALGLRYAIYYLAAYTFMNLGAFAVAAVLSADGISPENDEFGSSLEAYSGLGRRRPVLAAVMTVFLLGLAGLPPTAGFLGKILILASSANAGYAWLAAFLVLGTAISLYAYAKIIREMYSAGGDAPLTRQHARANGAMTHQQESHSFVPLAWISLVICGIAIVIMTFYPLTPSNVLPLVK
jgi:NADH-quinone oxidoreductase subunit N